MAPVALNVSPALRPWRQAGLVHLLVDRPLAEALRAAARVPVFQPVPDSCRDAGSVRPARPVGPGRAPSFRPTPPPDAAPPAAPVDVAADEARPAVWPAVWQSLWQRTAGAGARPAVVWTYAELGLDLCGQADSGRRRALRALLAELRLPKGSHAFWPYRLPPDDVPDPDMFLAGLIRFRPGLVLLAGEQVVADLAGFGALPSTSLQFAVCRGFRCMLLPRLDTMDGMAGPHRERLLTLIRETAL